MRVRKRDFAAEADLEEEEEKELAKRPRARFAELQPTADDLADAIDEEVPGSARADVDPLVLADRPYGAFEGGDPALSASRAAADPGFARAQRSHLRDQRQAQGALREALQAQEPYDQPEETHNEVGVPMEPFHLRREMEDGVFDAAGHYIELERGELRDAWLDSIDDRVAGVAPDRGRRLPPPNEPVAEPPPLARRELLPYLRRCLGVLQPGETVPAALRRLAGAGPVLDKFASRAEAREFFRDRIRSGHAVPAGNSEEFEALTEAAEVLFDAGRTGIYGATREQLAQQLHEQQQEERAPPAAAPSPAAAAAAAAEFGGASSEEAGQEEEDGGKGGAPGGAGRGRRHRAAPPAGPSAAAEPAVSPDLPSVPAAERTAATTRGGAGVGAAAHGFAAAVPGEVLEELPSARAPPREMEAGLGGAASTPTAEDLRCQREEAAGGAAKPPAGAAQQLRERRAGAPAEAQAAIDAALAEAAIAGGGAGGDVPSAPAAQQGQPTVKAVAFDNEAANLAALSAGGRSTPAEE